MQHKYKHTTSVIDHNGYIAFKLIRWWLFRYLVPLHCITCHSSIIADGTDSCLGFDAWMRWSSTTIISFLYIFLWCKPTRIVPWLWDIYTVFVFPLYPYCGCVVFPFWDNSKVGGNRWVMGAINQPQMISLWHWVYHGLPHYLHLKLCVSSFLKIPSTLFAKFPKAVLVGFQTLDLTLVHHGLQGTQNRNGTLEPLLLLGWKTW